MLIYIYHHESTQVSKSCTLLDAAHRSSTHRVTREEDDPSSLCAQRLEKTNRFMVDGSRGSLRS
jgi:hypothetical protein